MIRAYSMSLKFTLLLKKPAPSRQKSKGSINIGAFCCVQRIAIKCFNISNTKAIDFLYLCVYMI